MAAQTFTAFIAVLFREKERSPDSLTFLRGEQCGLGDTSQDPQVLQ